MIFHGRGWVLIFLKFTWKKRVVGSIRCRGNVTKYTRPLKFMIVRNLWAAVKMQGTVFIFQISAVGNKLLIGIWTGKVYWSYSHARLPKAFESSKRNNLFGKFVECALDVDKTCNDINQTLWEYRGLLSRKCTVKIHEVMVNNAHKIYLNLHFLTGPT